MVGSEVKRSLKRIIFLKLATLECSKVYQGEVLQDI